MSSAVVTERFLPGSKALAEAQANKRPSGNHPAINFGGGVPSLARHPADGWQLAAPLKLSKSGTRRMQGLMRVFLPSAPAPEVSGELEENVIDQCLRLLQYMHPITRLGFKLAMFLVDWAPLWRFKGPRRLTKTEPTKAAYIIKRMGLSRFPIVRTLVFAVRGLLLSTYFDQPEVHEALGYRPVPFMQSRMALRQRLLKGETATQSDELGHYSPVTQ